MQNLLSFFKEIPRQAAADMHMSRHELWKELNDFVHPNREILIARVKVFIEHLREIYSRDRENFLGNYRKILRSLKEKYTPDHTPLRLQETIDSLLRKDELADNWRDIALEFLYDFDVRAPHDSNPDRIEAAFYMDQNTLSVYLELMRLGLRTESARYLAKNRDEIHISNIIIVLQNRALNSDQIRLTLSILPEIQPLFDGVLRAALGHGPAWTAIDIDQRFNLDFINNVIELGFEARRMNLRPGFENDNAIKEFSQILIDIVKDEEYLKSFYSQNFERKYFILSFDQPKILQSVFKHPNLTKNESFRLEFKNLLKSLVSNKFVPMGGVKIIELLDLLDRGLEIKVLELILKYALTPDLAKTFYQLHHSDFRGFTEIREALQETISVRSSRDQALVPSNQADKNSNCDLVIKALEAINRRPRSNSEFSLNALTLTSSAPSFTLDKR